MNENTISIGIEAFIIPRIYFKKLYTDLNFAVRRKYELFLYNMTITEDIPTTEKSSTAARTERIFC